MLKGKQKKLDKNRDGKITGADFALMRKSGYKMGGMLKARSGASADRMTKRDVEYGTRKTIGLDPMDLGITAATGITGAAGLGAAGMILNEARKKYKKQKEYKKSKDSMTQGSFKTGGVMKAKTGDLAETMKKLRKRAYEKSMKKNKKVGRFGDDEYLIQKPLPGMKKGKAVMKAKDGDFIERRKKLGSYKAIVDINPMQSDLEKTGPSAFLMRRAMLSGASTLGSTAKETTKSIAKKTAKDAVKVGLGAGAGYEYAKSKKDKSKKDK